MWRWQDGGDDIDMRETVGLWHRLQGGRDGNVVGRQGCGRKW